MQMGHLLALVVGTIAIWLFAITIGRKLLDRWSPWAFRKLDSVDDRLVGHEMPDVRREFLRVQTLPLKELDDAVAAIIKRVARRAVDPTRNAQLVDDLPSSMKRFFSEYEFLAASETDVLLDSALLRRVSHDGSQFVVVGKSEDEPAGVYAIAIGNSAGRVVFIEFDEHGHIASLEAEASSPEQFIATHWVVAGHPLP